jgi:hypothetical protein
MGKNKDNEKTKRESALAATFRAVSGVRSASLTLRDGNYKGAVLNGAALTLPLQINDSAGQDKSIARPMAEIS